jgi:hypothetical protein
VPTSSSTSLSDLDTIFSPSCTTPGHTLQCIRNKVGIVHSFNAQEDWFSNCYTFISFLTATIGSVLSECPQLGDYPVVDSPTAAPHGCLPFAACLSKPPKKHAA